MNWQNIHLTLRERYANTGDERVLYVARRVNRLIKKRASRSRMAAKMNAKLQVEDTNHYHQLMKHLDRGSRIVAIDNEWTPYRPIIEIGLSEMNGPTHNVRITPGGQGFRHGTTRFMPNDQAKDWLTERLDGVGLIVGHMFKNDIKQYQRWGFDMPKIPVLDTGLWSKALYPPNHMNLKNLAEKYDIDAAGWHCAGNDAYITLMVALAMGKRNA